jgi:pilus assembly protein TadC
MRAGSPLPEALALAAPAAGDHAGALDQVGVLLRLGAEPAAAWGTVEADPLGQLARTAVRSAESGVRLAAALEASAQQLRTEFQTSARMRAERTGVLALAPLGLCFLPAFVCLGIVPVVVGIARDVSVALP